ncbi:MAG: LysR substrate-binding domain-containing protein [Planctomycetota bacterium]|nr:LysR substrate-binding domain-containing protein [Planctomycetota bacterium]
MEITIRQLEYFVALAETENFGRAAEQCFVTQPALSTQVAQLEKSLGVQLVERGRKATLTPAGEIVVVRARRILEEVRELHEGAASFRGPLVGRVRLGAIPSVSPYLLPRALPRIRERYADLQLVLREAPTRELLQALHAGDLDLLLLALGEDFGPVDEMELGADRFLLLAPSGHPLLAKKGLKQADLVDYDTLLSEDGAGLMPPIAEACLARSGADFDDFRAASIRTLVGMVANRQGITLVPELAAEVEVPEGLGLELARFEPPEPKRRIGMVWRRGATRAKEFRLLGQVIAQLI